MLKAGEVVEQGSRETVFGAPSTLTHVLCWLHPDIERKTLHGIRVYPLGLPQGDRYTAPQ